MFVVNLGIPRSASTWLNYALFGILSHSGEVAHDYADSWAEAELLLAAKTPHVLIKTHHPDQQVIEYARREGVFVLSARDPRDAVVSFVDGFGDSVSQRLSEVWRAAAATLLCSQFPRAQLWRYEDGFADKPRESLAALAGFLGVELSDAALDALSQDLSRSAGVETNVTMVEVVPEESDRDGGIVRIRTHWHTAHRKDGRIGKWRDAPYAAEIDSVLAPFVAAFGYPEPARLTVWPASLFKVRNNAENIPLSQPGLVLQGPTMPLPPGSWRLDAEITFGGDFGAGCEVHFDLKRAGGTWASYRLLRTSPGTQTITLTFENPESFPGLLSPVAFGLQVLTPAPGAHARLGRVTLARLDR